MRKKSISLYKDMEDDKLIETINQEINRMKSYLETEDMKEYWKIAMKVNDMIIETKNRSIKMKEGELLKKILLK